MTMLVSASVLRLTWDIVQESSLRELASLSDALLVRSLLKEVSQRVLLSEDEFRSLQRYLSDKVSLIRDMSEGRL
jgi:hypothetical protein